MVEREQKVALRERVVLEREAEMETAGLSGIHPEVEEGSSKPVAGHTQTSVKKRRSRKQVKSTPLVKEEMVDPIPEEHGTGTGNSLPNVPNTNKMSARRGRRGRGKATPAVMDILPKTTGGQEEEQLEGVAEQAIYADDTGLNNSAPSDDIAQDEGEETQEDDQRWLSELEADPLITAQPEGGSGPNTHLSLNEVQTKYLIGLYKLRPALYDPAHPDYRRGKSMTLVQEEMAQQLSEVFSFNFSEFIILVEL